MPDPSKPKPVRFDLAPDLHKSLKVAAAEEEMTMHEFIRAAIVAAIADRSIVRAEIQKD